MLALQAFISLFYAAAAAMMWGPFQAGPPGAKLIVSAIVLLPLMSLAFIRKRLPEPRLSAAIGLVTVLQICVVLLAATDTI